MDTLDSKIDWKKFFIFQLFTAVCTENMYRDEGPKCTENSLRLYTPPFFSLHNAYKSCKCTDNLLEKGGYV